MINGNQYEPAMPVDPALADTVGLCPTQSLGLTKREHFAGLAMQGFVSAKIAGPIEEYARHSVLFADALLKELDK